MKKISLVTMLILIVSLAFANSYQIDFGTKENAVKLQENDDQKLSMNLIFEGIHSFEVESKKGTFNQIVIPSTYYVGEIGSPKLPALKKLIEIPFGAEVSVNVLNYTTSEYKLSDFGIDNPIIPVQPSYSKSIDDLTTVDFEYDEAEYLNDRFSDFDLATVEVLGVMRGVRLARLEIAPVNYNPVTGIIKVYNNIDIEVNFSGSDSELSNHIKASTFSPYFEAIYSKITNYRETREEYPAHPDLTKYPVKYLIVADRIFEDELSDFIAWKTKKGFNVVVAYTDVIGTSASAIQTYIHAQYNAGTPTDPAPSFVLFVGDTDRVPASTIGSESGKATDLDYCSVDGDYFPEMYYGRMSAATEAHLTYQIDKILYYERYEFTDPSYLDDVTLIAGVDGAANPTHGQPTINYGTDYYFNVAHGYANINTYLTSYTGCYDADRIKVGFINYTAHCGETSWGDPTLSQTAVRAFTNTGKYPLAIGNCCLAADFGYAECIGETWMRQENAGAVGYIGSSPNSLWDEDVYWSVGQFGYCGDGSQIIRDDTTLGAYDAPSMSDYIAQDALVFVGDLAVTESGSSRTEYYWQGYNTLGDPSLVIYNTQGSVNTVNFDAILPIGVATFNVDALEGSYVAISMGGVLHGTALVGATGSVDVPITPFTSAGTADIVVTKPQYQPVQTTVTVNAVAGPFVSIESTVVDAGGDDVIEYGETVYLTVTLKNAGNDPATNVNMTLTESDSYITLTDAIESFGTLAAGASVTRTSAYICTVSNSVPDAHAFQLDGAISSTEDTWNDDMHFTAYAPVLSIQSVSVSDGDNNRLDPNETADLVVTIVNSGGAAASNSEAILSTLDSYITINNALETIGLLAGSSTGSATFNVTVDAGTPIGHSADFDVDMTADLGYSASDNFSLTIGLILEDFETNNFASFPWEFGGSANWSVVTETPYEGTYCAKSGEITSSQTTELILVADVTTAGDISFYRKVSSESGYDYLKFYINDVEQETWSGEVAWSEVSYSVAVGTDTEFKWQYSKDSSVDTGSDCAWVDYIVFPTITFPTPANISITPLSFEKILQPDNTTSDFLEIGNTGEATLNYTASIAYVERSVSTGKSKKSNSLSGKSKAYCASTYSNSGSGADDWIANVSFNTINNSTSYEDPDSYGDYTGITTNIELGTTYPLCVTLGYEGTFYTQHVRVWIDWNQDEIFTADESVYLGTAPDDGTYQICGDILVPVSATPGSTRMRIIEQYSSDPGVDGACDSHSTTFGETEDYTVNIGSGSSMTWLSLDGGSYVSGDVLGGDPDDVITVGFDASGLEAGVYEATITVNSDDPDALLTIISVTLNVIVNQNYPNWEVVTYPNNSATIYGTVSILGYDAEAGDLVGAFVGGECRGTGEISIARAAYITMLINVAENGEMADFKVYDLSADTVYVANYTTEINIGETIGSYPNDLQQIDVLGTLDVPQNVTIVTTPNGSDVDVSLSWTAVPGATSYTVYRVHDPNATFPAEWTAVTGVIGTSWSYTTSRAKRFYKVAANN